MPCTAFRFYAPEPQSMVVNLSWWGREQYILNGVVVLQQWKPSFFSTREFTVGSHVVRIEINTGLREYSARAFLDGELYIDELFPEYRHLIESLRSKESYRDMIISGVISGAIAAAIVALWK